MNGRKTNGGRDARYAEGFEPRKQSDIISSSQQD
jgi:hypothetical protein